MTHDRTKNQIFYNTLKFQVERMLNPPPPQKAYFLKCTLDTEL